MSYGLNAWSEWGGIAGRGFGIRAVSVKSNSIQTSWGYEWNAGYPVIRHDIWMQEHEDIWFHLPADGQERNAVIFEEEYSGSSRRVSIVGSNPIQYVITSRRGVVWYGGSQTYGMRIFNDGGECTYDSRCPVLEFNAFSRRFHENPNQANDDSIRNQIMATHGTNWNFMKQSSIGGTKVPYIPQQAGGQIAMGAGRMADGRAKLGWVNMAPRGAGLLLPISAPALTTARISQFSS